MTVMLDSMEKVISIIGGVVGIIAGIASIIQSMRSRDDPAVTARADRGGAVYRSGRRSQQRLKWIFIAGGIASSVLMPLTSTALTIQGGLLVLGVGLAYIALGALLPRFRKHAATDVAVPWMLGTTLFAAYLVWVIISNPGEVEMRTAMLVYIGVWLSTNLIALWVLLSAKTP